VRAELKKTGSPGWDVEVRDNVLKNPDDPNAPRLSNRALYVVQWDSFNTGGSNIADADFVARTGWDGSSYTGTRAAAPLAILDQIYSGIQAIVAERPNEVFLPLDAFWSVNNTLTSELNIDTGELTASFYRPDIDSLFLLGDAGVDTEEFDDHVVMHEWGHYFEDAFSRSDSIGGPHSIGQSLDARLAFGEGFATAMAAMVLEEQQYCDTSAAGSNSGFGISTESENRGLQGWMNEMSVATLIYDLWDTDDDGADNGSIGFGPGEYRGVHDAVLVCRQFAANVGGIGAGITPRTARSGEYRTGQYRYLGQQPGPDRNRTKPGARCIAVIY
jgi:hypothetical protein